MPDMSSRIARQVALTVLSRVNPGDIRIKHHWTGVPFALHSFRHRNYWFRGTSRERDIMMASMRLVQPGDVVYDVGGHIGYLTALFSYLGASVMVFEPGPNNLPYLRKNVAGLPGVEIIESAIGERIGEADLFVEDLTGQNNSLAGNFQLVENRKVARGVRVRTHTQVVPVTTIDKFSAVHGPPDLIKMDIEGYEWQALQGAEQLLRSKRPALIVELTNNVAEASAFLHDIGYSVFDDRFHALDSCMPTTEGRPTNVIFLHPDRHTHLCRGRESSVSDTKGEAKRR